LMGKFLPFMFRKQSREYMANFQAFAESDAACAT